MDQFWSPDPNLICHFTLGGRNLIEMSRFWAAWWWKSSSVVKKLSPQQLGCKYDTEKCQRLFFASQSPCSNYKTWLLWLSNSMHWSSEDLMWKIEKDIVAKFLYRSFSFNVSQSTLEFVAMMGVDRKVARYRWKALSKRTLHSTLDRKLWVFKLNASTPTNWIKPDFHFEHSSHVRGGNKKRLPVRTTHPVTHSRKTQEDWKKYIIVLVSKN